MVKKSLITLTQEKNLFDCTTLNISFARHLLGLVVFSAFDLTAFNQKGYLAKFIESFREKDKAVYLLFSSFGGISGASMIHIDKVLDMSNSYISMEPIIPEKWADKLLMSSPNPVYFLFLSEEGVKKIQTIFNYIGSIDTWCYFIFEKESNKEAIYEKMRELRKKKTLDEAAIVSLQREAIGLRFGKYGAEESFRVFTRRFTIYNLKSMILNAIEADKFKVVVK
ncbi:MAG: hypothetical protein PHY94_07450 [Candidatus Omnitrophica bacterium]|nr:hypothetical protein [Candidatus Omnitrophota bacterium]